MNKYYFRNNSFIYLSFVVAFLLQIMPWPHIIYILCPSWFLLFLIYWILALPHSINVSGSFLLGTVMDITSGSKLGIGSLIFSVIAYCITLNFQLIRSLNLIKQTFLVIFISIFMNLTISVIEFFIISASFRNEIFLNSIANGIIWPWFFLLLQKYYK
ncbi:rod shape-determining protein MreD [Candidatus Pantoea edessiphila]|uniref:Rod shape-determining protein MreD n=1 Tax=Candidatus Pantoea edessiphila TaxID=2044610 RepID=A0A2P5SXQ1_9GAMM|nr:rod shape-determining protein MreD [Candidatus Pantoea edessiphila]MBK4775719.1 rod shape-determining protein MreD [Pantoea sp. Edef]PPI87116.1 rod shape-determining protein MreD [Candidatus Pantoea edessiphila]